MNASPRWNIAQLRTLLFALPLVASLGCQSEAPIDAVTEQQQMDELNQARQKEWSNE